MTPAKFFEYFHTLAGTPNAVAKMRELILQLAVQGKLVPQDPNDDPAKVLLERIRREKSSAKVTRQKASSAQLTDVELRSFPPHWVSTRLGECIDLVSGQHLMPDEYNESGDGHPYLTGPADFGKQYPAASRWTRAERALARYGDILITVKGAGIGKTNVLASETAFISRQLMAVRPILLDRDYVHLVLQSAYDVFQRHGVGIAIPGIGRDDICSHNIGLPPLAEQRRIVAKVDELMKLCDELEKQEQRQRTMRQRLSAASLDRLLAARDPHEFAAHWQRICRHFDLLYDAPETIGQLRQAILQLAVMGKLVTQDPNDEHARELLDRIDIVRERLVAQGRIRPEPLIKNPVLPQTHLPRGWVWVALGRVTFCRDGERIPVSKGEREGRAKIYDYYGASGAIDKIDSYLFDKPLLLIGEDGANLVNRSTPIAFMAEGKYWVNNHAHVLDGINRALLEYLRVYINSIDLEQYITGMAQPKMNQARMNSIPVPLPPLAEQRRIVAKVDHLMSLCDTLESGLCRSRMDSERLLAAAVHSMLSG